MIYPLFNSLHRHATISLSSQARDYKEEIIMTEWVHFLQKITEETDKIAMRLFKAHDLGITIKDNMTPVSQGDLEIEDHIRHLVKQSQLEISIIGEEYGETRSNSNLKLIIDPIDGTKNFIRGLPFFATLLAIEEDGEIIAGLVSAPATGDKWWAEKGKGSFHNGKKIHVSEITSLDKSLALHGSLFGSEASNTPEPVISLLQDSYRQRGFGDYYPHMLVAMGCAEFAFDFKLQIWDIAPLKIIVEEAGGRFSDTDGVTTIHSGNLITSNGHLHDTVQDRLNGIQ
ncbi:histidinol-phosphatase [Candidatus Marinamargulisbacteria bacterium SCGC AG-439-L15]|nr:histidinol-phosphatase [Candidatus Marinamargulisbacteria bacterium SCGC AG-439-L15]